MSGLGKVKAGPASPSDGISGLSIWMTGTGKAQEWQEVNKVPLLPCLSDISAL